MFGLNKIIPVEPKINFLGLRRNFLIFSILAMLISIVLLSIKGLNLDLNLLYLIKQLKLTLLK